MAKEFIQDWVTLEFAGKGDMTQPQEGWVDLEQRKGGVLMFQQTACSMVNVFTETAPDVEGPWTAMTDSATPATALREYAMMIFGGVGSDAPVTNRVQRYLRWHAQCGDPSGGYICFRMTWLAK